MKSTNTSAVTSETIENFERRLAAVQDPNDETGWGELRSLRNFVQCDVCRQLQDWQPFLEELEDKSEEELAKLLEEKIVAQAVAEMTQLKHLLRDNVDLIGQKYITSIAAMHHGKDFVWQFRYFPCHPEQFRWQGRQQSTILYAPTIEKLKALLNRPPKSGLFAATLPRRLRDDVWYLNLRGETDRYEEFQKEVLGY